MRRHGSSCGESRTSGLWGAPRGGRGRTTDGRNRGAVRRGLLALALLALAAPFAAAASGGGNAGSYQSYLAPSLERAAAQTPNASVPVIVAMTMRGGCGSMLRLCRSMGCMSFFASVNLAQSQFTEEGHKP